MPPSEPAVSVVMIFRDAGRFIDEAIRSVEAQTFTDWELVLVDDGSKDDGPAIVAAHASRLGPRLRLLRHPGGGRGGTGPSRNLGLQAARGRYLAFLDADDVYEPRRLESHVQCLERDRHVGIVVSPELYWRSWQSSGGRAGLGDDRIIGPAVTPGRRIEPPAMIVAMLLTEGAPLPATGSLTFRAAAYARVGGIPDGFSGHYEDQALLCKLLLEYPCVALDECLMRYRQHPGSLTQANAPLERQRGSDAWTARRHFLGWLGPYVRSRGVRLPELDEWIGHELAALERSPGHAVQRTATRAQSIARWSTTHLWLAGVAGALGRVRHRLRASRIRRSVMRRVARLEACGPTLDRAIRAYWNERIHDTRLSPDPPGTAAFFAALDEYRLRKNPYLGRIARFDAWAGHDVLDIGCGAGLDLVRFSLGGARVVGLDVATAALELAHGACASAGVSATLVEADGAQLPFPDASFDLVYCHGVLSFARDPAAIIREAHRVLRPGGQAILMVYNRHSWMSGLLKIPSGPVRRGHADAPGFRTYTRREFERMLGPLQIERFVVERPPPFPASLQRLSARWLRPLGWHLLALCRRPG